MSGLIRLSAATVAAMAMAVPGQAFGGEICVRIMRPDGRHSHAIANLQEAIGAGLSFGWAASPP